MVMIAFILHHVTTTITALLSLLFSVSISRSRSRGLTEMPVLLSGSRQHGSNLLGFSHLLTAMTIPTRLILPTPLKAKLKPRLAHQQEG
ncbi:hypothetical protein D9758_013314 [Tetrapyrgos nigripes]|uniref:Uncharacterized protein n=1 Tax=Tetrapyrgos nigripes TaxID=182062 RepID=A0A8H5CCG6_9AGAR|nr:hypothetical protein D9758_013314 [Tetrapyrgos nigripes]